MKHLDEANIRKLAAESMLTLSDEEVEIVKENSKVFLAQIEALKTINVEGIEIMNYPFEVETEWLRNDEETYVLDQAAVFKNAPLVEGDFIEIVKVLK